MKLEEARHLLQVRIAAEPDLLEGLFRPFPHAKAVHGDEHVCSPVSLECSRRASAQYRTGGEGSLSRSWRALTTGDGVEVDGSAAAGDQGTCPNPSALGGRSGGN